MASSDTGGVQGFSIGRRMVSERERLLGMTDEERAWRAQYLKDQELAPEEPIIDRKQWYLANRNPIRRFYRAPLDKFEEIIAKPMGEVPAAYVRYFTGKLFLSVLAVYGTFYYFKYNANDWTRKGGWRVIKSRKMVVPGDPDFPQVSNRTKPSDYSDRNFVNSPI